MPNNLHPLEGKIVILKYIECDHSDEGEACLVFKVVHGKAETLFGVLNLPDGCYWPDSAQRSLDVIKKQGVTEVYCPQFGNRNFLGQDLGFGVISEDLNERGEVECWFEISSFYATGDMVSLLKEYGIKIFYVDTDTFKIVAQD